MVNVQTLSDEVLVQIAEYLAFRPGASLKKSTYALCSLSLCSRRFHQICRSILYKSIPVYTNRAILCLTRAVLRRRDICEEVRHLEVSVSEDHGSTCLTKHLENQFQTILQQLSLPRRASKAWREHLQSNRDGASVALLLVLLPNFTLTPEYRVRLPVPGHVPPLRRISVVFSAVCCSPNFAHTLCACENEYLYSSLTPLLTSPSLPRL